MPVQLEQLYQEARSALKAKDYIHASNLLRQILQIDENYKDASRLLAQTVKLRRRRWYNHPLLWGTLAGATIIGLLVWGIPKLSLDRMFASPAPSATVTSAPPNTPMLTQTAIPTVTFTPAPTPVPLAWKRISIGQEFPRDTVSAIVVDPNDPDVIYVGMSNAGIYKSIDGGVSWRPAFTGIRKPSVSFLRIDPKNPQTLYAISPGESNFISTDGGENWQRANPEDAQNLFLDPQNSAHLFAWSGSIFFESVDGGKTWTTNYESKEGDCPQSFSGTDTAGFLNETSTLYLLGWGDDTCPTGIYQSKDAGHTWTFLYGGMEGSFYEFDIGRDSQGNAIFYVITNDGLLASYDEGQTWTNAAPENCSPLVVDAESPARAYCRASDARLLVTKDGGRTWNNFGVEANFGRVSSIHIDHPRGTSRILVGGTNGLFASTDDGNSWIEMTNGLGATNLQVRIHPSDNSMMFADAQAEHYLGCSLFRSQDHGKTWNSILTSQYDARCEPEFDVNGNIYLIQGGSIAMSSDKGGTWQPLPKPYGVNKMMWVNVSQYQSAPLFGGDLENSVRPLRVFYSNDIGNTWTLGSEVDSEARRWDLRLLFDPQGKYIYAQGFDDVFRSENGGMTWLPCAAMDNIGPGRSDTSLAINPKDGAHFFLATASGASGGLFFTLDACQTWQKTSLDSLFVNTVAIDPIDTNIIYAGTSSGAYVSFDSGQSWGQINDGLLGATVVYSIVVDKNGNVYAATPYGIFKLEGK